MTFQICECECGECGRTWVEEVEPEVCPFCGNDEDITFEMEETK